ncbi:MAG: hypothetical protein ACK559_40170 [bacterium]
MKTLDEAAVGRPHDLRTRLPADLQRVVVGHRSCPISGLPGGHARGGLAALPSRAAALTAPRASRAAA